VLIPLIALAALVILGLGGYKGIMSFAMDEMTGFLVGTGGRADDGLLAQAGAPKAESAAAPTAAREATVASAVTPGPEVSKVEAAIAEPAPVLLAQSQPAAKPPETRTTAPPVEKTAEPRREPAVTASALVQPAEVRVAEKIYTASFLRDPFFSLVQAGKDRPSKLLDVGRAKMVGSVWGEAGIIALLEDEAGRSYALKVGDRVLDGRVISVTPASITFSITVFGLTKSVTLELAEEGD
jgi:hypothetical protein